MILLRSHYRLTADKRPRCYAPSSRYPKKNLQRILDSACLAILFLPRFFQVNEGG